MKDFSFFFFDFPKNGTNVFFLIGEFINSHELLFVYKLKSDWNKGKGCKLGVSGWIKISENVKSGEHTSWLNFNIRLVFRIYLTSTDKMTDPRDQFRIGSIIDLNQGHKLNLLLIFYLTNITKYILLCVLLKF